MENVFPKIDPKLRQELFLLGRKHALEKVNEVLNGKLGELCLRTRYPKELDSFIVACLAKRGELNTGAGDRCLFVRNRETWQRLCETEQSPRILVAHAELDFEAHREELLRLARVGGHAAIYALTSPRPDIDGVVELQQPQKHEVEEVLRSHGFPSARAERLATESNGNVYLLSQLLSGTTERRKWATPESAPGLRYLALLGGWDEAISKDKSAVARLVADSYDAWIGAVYPVTRQEEPPVMLEGTSFRPVSRYEL